MFEKLLTFLPKRPKRVRTPTVLQMEAVECGAAALAIVLEHYGKIVSLEELRVACGISRDGSKASNILAAARGYGLVAKGYQKEARSLADLPLPLIVHWNFNHFLVLEGWSRRRVYLNDPASGPRWVSHEEFDRSFTGVVLSLAPGPDFQKGGEKPRMWPALRKRLAGSADGLAYVVLASLILVVPGLIIPVFAKVFIDYILVRELAGWIWPLLLGMLLTASLRAALTWIQQFYLLRLESKLSLSTSSQFLWHTLHLPVEFFNQRYGGEIGARVRINDRVAQVFSRELVTAVLNTILVILYAVVMFIYDVRLTLVSIVGALLNMIALSAVSRHRRDGNQRVLQERGQLIGIAMSGLQTIETLKATGSESDLFAHWSGQQAKTLNAEQQLQVSSRLLEAVPPLLYTLNTAVILWVGGRQVMDGALTIGMLVAFQSLASSFSEPVSRLVNLGATLQQVSGDLARLDDVLRHPRDPLTAASPELQTSNLVKLSGYIELKGVTFGYNRLAPPLIENLSLSLKPGSRVALVGGSGSGKSTVIKLIAGLYQPWSGEILFDGYPRERWPRSLLNNSMAFVDQDIFLFEGTGRENLTLWDATLSEANVIQAAKDAHIHLDIADRPGGYDLRIDEEGRNLSGGQRQRIEIARALARDPTILLLDEATSALDPVTEKIIDDNLRRRGCACLIVAHRLSTIRDCDEIIVLERGQVVQRGTHEEMSRVDGPYTRLIRDDVTLTHSAEVVSSMQSVLESVF